MNILVIGSGGREHALVWKLHQSPQVKTIFCAPGNAGIEQLATLVPLKPNNIKGLLKFAKEKNIPLISELDNKPSMNLYRDVIHINDAGQRFLFNELYPLLIKKVGVVVCGFKTD